MSNYLENRRQATLALVRALQKELDDRGVNYRVAIDQEAYGGWRDVIDVWEHNTGLQVAYVEVKNPRDSWGRVSASHCYVSVIDPDYKAKAKTWKQRKDGSFNVKKIVDHILLIEAERKARELKRLDEATQATFMLTVITNVCEELGKKLPSSIQVSSSGVLDVRLRVTDVQEATDILKALLPVVKEAKDEHPV